MEFESLQAIWDTQNDKPVFAMQDARLLLALYQQRERSRRWLFQWHFGPLYGAALLMLAAIGSIFATFLNVARLMRRYKGFTHNGFGMSAWDYAGFAVAAGALLALVASLYRERKKHERTQEIFAPSLREELDLGIAQLDFVLRVGSTPSVMRLLTLLSIAVVMISWEAQRAGGNPTPWWSALGALWVFLPGCLGFAAGKKGMERRLARRRALESMRAALDEDRSNLTTESRREDT